MGDVAVDHVQEFILAAAVEAEPQAEAVGQRHLLLDGFARIDRGRALVLHHVARHQVAPVRRGVEYDVVRPPLDAAFEHGLERFVAGVFGFEREVVAEHDEAVGRPAHQRHQVGQTFDVLAVDFDELERPVTAFAPCVRNIDLRVHGLDQRRFAHAARSPQQRVVGRQPAREALRVLQQHIAHAVDALEQ